ncbi:Synembryn-A [Halotydeus destructor]|nr:Synembryn-A [Halotydeus destructor]
MDQCISAFKGSTKEMVEKLTEFNIQNGQQFSLEEPVIRKKQLVDCIYKVLRDPERTDQYALCLATLRILTRDKKHLDELFAPDRIETILHLANLVGEEEAYMTDNNQAFDAKIVVEAQKCLCNLIYNNGVIQRMCCSNSCIDGIMLRMRMFKDPQLPMEIKYFDMRMLFLLTALCADVRPRIRDESHGLIYLMEVIDLILKTSQEQGEKTTKKSLRRRKGSKKGDKGKMQEGQHLHLDDAEADLACEVLKVLFNLTCNLDRNHLNEVEEAHFMRLVAILHDLLLTETKTHDKREDLISHTVNLLTNMPLSCYEELLVSVEEIGRIDNPLYEYEDTNVEAVAVLLEFLGKRLKPPEKPVKQMHESLAPILICLSEMARANRVIRKYLRCQVLPPLDDVLNRPEEGDTIRNKLVKLMTNPNTDVKELVADLLFVLCKENVGRLIKYTGYGNAAGLLANRGLMLGGNGSREYSSDSEDSDTEEYSKYRDKINPIIGCYENPKPNPLEGMSDEQKEYEAMRLVNAIEKMTSAGVVRPCRVGVDGKPLPIEHILELTEKATIPQAVNDDSD